MKPVNHKPEGIVWPAIKNTFGAAAIGGALETAGAYQVQEAIQKYIGYQVTFFSLTTLTAAVPYGYGTAVSAISGLVKSITDYAVGKILDYCIKSRSGVVGALKNTVTYLVGSSTALAAAYFAGTSLLGLAAAPALLFAALPLALRLMYDTIWKICSFVYRQCLICKKGQKESEEANLKLEAITKNDQISKLDNQDDITRVEQKFNDARDSKVKSLKEDKEKQKKELKDRLESIKTRLPSLSKEINELDEQVNDPDSESEEYVSSESEPEEVVVNN